MDALNNTLIVTAIGTTLFTVGAATIPIPTDFTVPTKEIQLDKLDREIMAKMGYKHSAPGVAGYSGLELDEVDGGIRIHVVWSDDGITGYAKPEFTMIQKQKIEKAINDHVK